MRKSRKYANFYHHITDTNLIHTISLSVRALAPARLLMGGGVHAHLTIT